MSPTEIRQSQIKLWSRCPLQYKYEHIDKLPREQSGSLTFGSIIHENVLYLETTGDLPGAIARFYQFWDAPTTLDPTYGIDYYVRGTNWKKYYDLGPKLLKQWWAVIQWDSDANLAREHYFRVPIGNGHTLEGTADKVAVRYMPKINRRVLLVSDYKSSAKTPTYDYLLEDVQFSSYAWASTQIEFWNGITNGEALFEQLKDAPRWGEWVALTTGKRMDAGERTQRHYNRLFYAVDAIAASIEASIFPPNISGENCRWCDWRKQCGMPGLDADGQVLS